MPDETQEFKPDWLLPPEPADEDEPQVRRWYGEQVAKHTIGYVMPWERLPEWQRESWRREWRHGRD